MISPEEIEKIKRITKELLQEMTMADFKIEAAAEENNKEAKSETEDAVNLNINLEEPQFLIGQNGQTLSDLQRILRIILNKKLQKRFYLKLDINDYQKQKIEYLKDLAKSLANQAVLAKEKKFLPPMPAYERRIIHEELAKRQDIVTQSQGEGDERCVSIMPR